MKKRVKKRVVPHSHFSRLWMIGEGGIFLLGKMSFYLIFSTSILDFEFGTLPIGRVPANGESGERRRDVFPSFPKSVDH